jgi:hypothetical protein
VPSTRQLFTILAAVLSAGVLSSCGGQAASAPPVTARLISHAGSASGEIVLTALGAQRIGVVTTSVRRPPAPPAPPSPPVTTPLHRTLTALHAAAAAATAPTPAPAPPRPAGVLVPASAIVYDPTGRTLLFTSPAPLRYVQQVVDVERFEGGEVLLRHGPSAGTAVVSVGAEELFGVQSGVLAQT